MESVWCPHTHTHTFHKTISLHPMNPKSIHTWKHLCHKIDGGSIEIDSPTYSLNLHKHFQDRKAPLEVGFVFWGFVVLFIPSNQEIYFLIYGQLTGKSPFFSAWQTVCQLSSPCHVSLPLPTHARRPSLLLLPLAPYATFVIDHWSDPVPTCSSSAYTSNEVLVV